MSFSEEIAVKVLKNIMEMPVEELEKRYDEASDKYDCSKFAVAERILLEGCELGTQIRVHEDAEKHRVKSGPLASPTGLTCGAFSIPYRSVILFVVVSNGKFDGWEHVSVSLKNRCPN